MVMQAPMQQLVQCLSVLPGVGEKTATRLALYLVNCPAEQALALSDAIAQARERIRLCSLCYNYTEKELCPICASTVRERRVVCVVETPGDIISFERIGGYDGCYHVLHGSIAPLDGIGPDQLRVSELLARVENGGIDELRVHQLHKCACVRNSHDVYFLAAHLSNAWLERAVLRPAFGATPSGS